MPPYVEAYPNENLTTVMPEQYRYTLPVKAGEQRLLGELTGAACATLVAEIAERHAGLVPSSDRLGQGFFPGLDFRNLISLYLHFLCNGPVSRNGDRAL